jgi:hypothetical protein
MAAYYTSITLLESSLMADARKVTAIDAQMQSLTKNAVIEELRERVGALQVPPERRFHAVFTPFSRRFQAVFTLFSALQGALNNKIGTEDYERYKSQLTWSLHQVEHP